MTVTTLEEIYMKLLRLQIEKLYGHYNYDNITFNSDVTFLYGLNGCGKTTILNITEAIITGQIYKLFDYDFKKIVLQYAPKNNTKKVQEIVIVREDNQLRTKFNEQENVIERNIEILKESRGKDRDFEKIRYYFNRYNFLMEIKRIFNYVYLPLNRSSVVYDFDNEDNMFFYRRNRAIYVDDSFEEAINKDLAMVQIERLIEESCRKIYSQISDISDRFRNNILKSSLDVNEQYTDSDNLLNEIINQQANINSIRATKTAYIKILKDLSLITKDEEIHFAEFFDGICNDISKGKETIQVTTLLKMNEVIKIKKIVSLAEEMERQKADIRKPIEKFIDTMNEFINTGEDEKVIRINPMGHVYFTTKYSKKPISIQFLSSGEKQLITFFANLIFKVKNSTSGIFVVDEPELSLHLFWQKIFVEKTLEINKNIQLIFATHAPEIIGKNRDKTFKLEKKYVD